MPDSPRGVRVIARALRPDRVTDVGRHGLATLRPSSTWRPGIADRPRWPPQLPVNGSSPHRAPVRHATRNGDPGVPAAAGHPGSSNAFAAYSGQRSSRHTGPAAGARPDGAILEAQSLAARDQPSWPRREGRRSPTGLALGRPQVVPDFTCLAPNSSGACHGKALARGRSGARCSGRMNGRPRCRASSWPRRWPVEHDR